MISRLKELGLSSEKAYIHGLVNREEKQKELCSKVENADLIILAFPLYVDSLPAPDIKAMELIAEFRQTSKSSKKQGFIAIVNSGFPEALQNNTALEICRIFARDVGFEWKGGLALGAGEAIRGRPLEERGGMVRNVKKGFDIAAKALAEGEKIPQEAIDLVAKPLMPKSMYKMVGNLSWKIKAKKFGARKKLMERPYLEGA